MTIDLFVFLSQLGKFGSAVLLVFTIYAIVIFIMSKSEPPGGF